MHRLQKLTIKGRLFIHKWVLNEAVRTYRSCAGVFWAWAVFR